MTFASPQYLLFLAAIPVAVGLVAFAFHTRNRALARFRRSRTDETSD